MKIGLLFGSFNPIHIGHLAIANYMAEFTDLDQVWLIVSPHSPAKDKKGLASATSRLFNVQKAVGKNPKIKVSDIEFFLSEPSYTIHTLEKLSAKFPKNKFVLIIGADNLTQLTEWKDCKTILSNYKIYVYPRTGARRVFKNHKNVKLVKSPIIDISSTFIREQVKKGKDMRYFLP